MRGKWATTPASATRVNVTSAQPATSRWRQDFSPMTAIRGGYKGYYCFKNYWQGGKVYEGITHSQSQQWWLEQTQGIQQYPAAEGVRCSEYDGTVRDYLTSRMEVYVPEYDTLMRLTPSFEELRRRVMQGEDVAILDFDGPRLPRSPGNQFKGGVTCDEVNLSFLREKIVDESFPFGHGYVIGAGLKGYEISDYLHPQVSPPSSKIDS